MDTMVLERPEVARKNYGSTKQVTLRVDSREYLRFMAWLKNLDYVQIEGNKLSLEKSADLMQSDYETDKELTAFTQLDGEHFYETR
jgi:hypothetical protein